MTVTRVPASNPEPEEAPAVNREALNNLLSMPYDEPDMADVERVCDEVRHEVPITDPRWLVSTQPDPTPEIDGGLDGRGTTHAADLPASAHVWGQTLAPMDLEIDTEGEAPVKRTLCLALSDDRNMPLQCRFKLDHATRHEWEIDNSPLTEGRAERLREEQGDGDAAELERLVRLGHVIITPSGRLPVRTPGAALRAEEGSDGPGGPGESARPGDRILGRWVC